ncbi:MAG: peptidase M22 [Clostridia bacterium]|nr:peptidase M22 [Clostridia bacterium]
MNALGIDTSNYTTSCALYGAEAFRHERRLLPVKPGERGIRQSDAVFHHTQQLPALMESLLADAHGQIEAVGASARPRDVEGSYMPCFTVGSGAARSIAAALGIPVYLFSHQAGHLAAALVSTGRTELLRQPFIAFHVSGGTTEALLVRPDDQTVFSCELLGATEDLNAGQVIDRTGVRLGLQFPCGPELEKLAAQSTRDFHPKVCVRGGNCSLSGLENQCGAMLANGEAPADIARYCLSFVAETLLRMTKHAVEAAGDLPLLFAGGVMSNQLIRAAILNAYPAYFASPALSCDNAVGVAALTYWKKEGAV